MEAWWSLFVDQLSATSWLEGVAVLFGLLSVWFSKQENILVYPSGIISVLIYTYLTFVYRLYADMGINAYYFFMSVYGWYHWMDTGDPRVHQIPITRTNRSENIIGILIVVVSFVVIRLMLGMTDSDVPNLDALTTSIAITGMWLMARKKIENWVAWIITDLISVPLYFYKGLPLTGIQFLIFTLLAGWGYWSWNKQLTRK